MKTSMKPRPAFSCSSRATARSARYGEMKAVAQMQDASAKSLETYIEVGLRKREADVNGKMSAYLSDSADILVTGLLVETKVLVQAKSDVVTIETVAEFLEV